MQRLRIATRESPLAVRQAELVSKRLESVHHGLNVVLVPMKTSGDRMLHAPLSTVGGKGVFVKELEQAILDGRADVAVHSMKDVPVALPAGLALPVILVRGDPRDAIVSRRFPSLGALPAGSRVGTSSLRRKCQLRVLRSDVELFDLRGNIHTRLRRLDAGDFDAVVLARVGLTRMGLDRRIAQTLEPHEMLPAIGQGAMGIECREDDGLVNELINPLHDSNSADCVHAERALNLRLEGGCQVPIAAHAVLDDDEIVLNALVSSLDGTRVLRAGGRAPRHDAPLLGSRVAEELLAEGADAILREVWAG